MASTFGGVLLLSRRAIWTDNFMQVEELIGKAHLRLGKKIIDQNLQDKVKVSPMEPMLNCVKVTLIMDGGWDQHASGREDL
jgi:hypothetical protein